MSLSLIRFAFNVTLSPFHSLPPLFIESNTFFLARLSMCFICPINSHINSCLIKSEWWTLLSERTLEMSIFHIDSIRMTFLSLYLRRPHQINFEHSPQSFHHSDEAYRRNWNTAENELWTPLFVVETLKSNFWSSPFKIYCVDLKDAVKSQLICWQRDELRTEVEKVSHGWGPPPKVVSLQIVSGLNFNWCNGWS